MEPLASLNCCKPMMRFWRKIEHNFKKTTLSTIEKEEKKKSDFVYVLAHNKEETLNISSSIKNKKEIPAFIQMKALKKKYCSSKCNWCCKRYCYHFKK